MSFHFQNQIPTLKKDCVHKVVVCMLNVSLQHVLGNNMEMREMRFVYVRLLVFTIQLQLYCNIITIQVSTNNVDTYHPFHL